MTSSPSSREMLIVSIRNNDIENFRVSLETLRHSRRGFSPAEALSLAVREASSPIVKYLIEQDKAPVAGLGPSRVSTALTWAVPGEDNLGKEEKAIGVWENLLENGWDVNSRESEDGQYSNGDRLLTLVCHNDHLVKWLLSHGAVAADPFDLDSFNTPPILERVASVGSVSTFKLLKDHGAQITRRVLHRAVESAAYAEKRENFEERMKMVRFLVEDASCDVNGMDVVEGQQLPNYWGTPAAYAVHNGPGSDREGQVVELVGYLLEKGADPSMKDCWGNMSLLDRAERAGSQKILDLMRIKENEREGLE